jgi:hypothetical protein
MPEPLAPTPVPPWLRTLVRWMDEALPVPGTNLRIGLDAVLGLLLPGAGDAVTAVSHLALLWTAFRARVPSVVLARMLLNVAIDALLGAFPVVGDLFDVVFKANRRNLDLLERNRGQAAVRATSADYAMVIGAMLLALAVLSLPLILIALLAAHMTG